MTTVLAQIFIDRHDDTPGSERANAIIGLGTQSGNGFHGEDDMYREEKTFNFRFNLEASFPDEYEGEEDNLAWLADWDRRIKPDLLKLLFDYLRRQTAWTVRVRNRGVSPNDEIEVCLVRDGAKSGLSGSG